TPTSTRSREPSALDFTLRFYCTVITGGARSRQVERRPHDRLPYDLNQGIAKLTAENTKRILRANRYPTERQRMFSLPTVVASPPRSPLPSGHHPRLRRGRGPSPPTPPRPGLRGDPSCETPRCPTRRESPPRRTATFMILGNICTRPCGFCSVPRGTPEAL